MCQGRLSLPLWLPGGNYKQRVLADLFARQQRSVCVRVCVYLADGGGGLSQLPSGACTIVRTLEGISVISIDTNIAKEAAVEWEH